MLMTPAFQTVEDVTVFRDDTVWFKFYPIADHPEIRRDENGKPVFLLVKYAFSDQERRDNPDLPPGGGYLNFDVQFAVPADQLARVREHLQAWVNEEWERLRNGTPEERALPGVAGTTAPPMVEIGTPTWTSGVAKLDAPQSEDLVEKRIAEGVPSLLTQNVAMFSLDLSPSGATFMERTLVGDGDEGSNLTPLQVGYDLTFWARLPPVRINVTSQSERIYEHVREVMDGKGVHACTTYDFENTDIDTETAHAAGLIDVQIDTGSGSVDDQTIQELRQYALDMIQDMIENSFFTDDPSQGLNGETPADLPDPNRNPANTKRYLRKSFDKATMDVKLNLEQSAVVEWPIYPRATLQTFFEGMSESELKQFVRSLTLDDDFFNNLNLEVRVFADFDDPLLSAVEVEVVYEGDDANGEHVVKTDTFTFTDDTPQTWKPTLIGSAREYRYRYRVNFNGGGFGSHSGWQTGTSPDLNVAVPAPGRVVVDVITGDVNFTDLVSQVQVTLAYEDDDIPRREHTVVLDANNREERWEHVIFDFVRRPVQYKCRYLLHSGEVIDGDFQTTTSRTLVINQPFERFLRVRLVPTGNGWEDVAQAIVDLRYSDPANEYEAEGSFTLKSNAEFKQWQVVLRDRDKRDFEYRTTVSYKNGDLEQSGWERLEGDATIPIHVKAPPTVKVNLISDMLDFAAAPITEVVMRYNQNGVEETETFVFRDKTPQTWTIRVADGMPLRYTYQVTHFPPDNEPVQLPEKEETDKAVVLPAYKPPKSGTFEVRVLSQLLDFEQTPLVTVDLEYTDEAHNVREVTSMAFSSKMEQSWAVPVMNMNHKVFGYKVTYFKADGSAIETPMKFQESPLVILQKPSA